MVFTQEGFSYKDNDAIFTHHLGIIKTDGRVTRSDGYLTVTGARLQPRRLHSVPD